MKIYACYTPSHVPLLHQHFLPSLQLGGFTPHDLVLKELPQEGTGEFDTAGFHATCVRKVEFILEALAAETEPFVFSDVDVRFYGPVVADLLAQLGDADILFQDDGPGGNCTGFFIVRPSDYTREVFRLARWRMGEYFELDQPAVNKANNSSYHMPRLPRPRYWTIGQDGQHWGPGQPVNPPADLLMHHANWTTGVPNKMALLEAVLAQRLQDKRDKRRFIVHETPPTKDQPAQDMIARSPLGPTAAAAQLLEQQRARLTSHHHPMPLALVLQFWKGDKRRALDLARLLADVEPHRRDDVAFVFARQSNCPMDAEIQEAQLAVGMKFPVIDLVTEVDETKHYPGICYDPWASAARKLADAYYSGRLPYSSAFFLEADGCPLRATWIDDLKRAHAETLLLGKYVTGPVMRYGGHHHVNGSLVMYLPFFANNPGLHRCPPDVAWDVFFAPLLVNAAGPSLEIRNEHGMLGLTLNQYYILAKESCWVTSLKDGLAHHWARRELVRE